MADSTLAPLPSPQAIAERILAGERDALDGATLTRYLAGEGDLWELMAAADRLRRARFGDSVHLCSIVNAKRGGCPEDCGFCAQSRRYNTGVEPERFLEPAAIVDASARAGEVGSSALGLVTATRGLEDGSRALAQIVAGVRAVRDAGHTEAHASLGFVSRDALAELKEAGLTELNHNLESGRAFFSKIVSTHTYDARIQTIRDAQALGLRTCVGGIFGMGEAPEDRAELALELRALDVDEVPLNFLVDVEGTPLAGREPLEPRAMLRIIAAFRLALPRQNIFLAAGRHHLGQLLPLMFSAGASGMMIGDFLTTPNRTVDDDLELLEMLGLQAQVCGAPRPELAAEPRPAARARAEVASARHLPVVA
ncbi:MAG: biotin synthase BioB [Myxococcales bacterium]|nr:biotin synthase BioB [Myxococcales bacterium]